MSSGELANKNMRRLPFAGPGSVEGADGCGPGAFFAFFWVPGLEGAVLAAAEAADSVGFCATLPGPSQAPPVLPSTVDRL